MGRLIPAGTGLPIYRNLSVETAGDLPDELDAAENEVVESQF